MADLAGRKVFKVFNQDFIVDERYTVTKELGQGAYGIVWYALRYPTVATHLLTLLPLQRGYQLPDPRRRCDQEGDQCLQQEDFGQACSTRDKAATTFQRTS